VRALSRLKPFLAALSVLLAVCASWVSQSAAADRSGKCPGWLPVGELSPFFPDDGFTLQVKDCKEACLRKSFDLAGAPKRAVLAVTGFHTVAVWLNGSLVAENHADGPDHPPAFAEVTQQLRAGKNDLDVRVWTEWSPVVYVQLRVELADGSFVDVATDDTWETHPGAAEGGPRGKAPTDGWQKALLLDDYYGSGGEAKSWQKEFALMPRDLLRERVGAFNQRLQAEWTAPQGAPKSAFGGECVKPEYAAQYGNVLRLDPATGQVLDATGKVRHLFFTIYGQKLAGGSTLGWDGFDFDLLEHDLTLMEAACVHPYLRFVGWGLLLDAEGNWRRCEKQPAGANLPKFTYNYEILDYFLDRCQAHGRFVAVECDFFWAANWDTLPAPYHTRYYLYPEVAEANALAHRKLLSRLADRACVAGFMIGEEDIIMAPDLDNGHLRAAFQEYLRGRYGALGRLAETWQRGYDYADHSQWKTVNRKPGSWGLPADANAGEDVLLSNSPLVDGFWTRLQNWSQLDLPVWPRFRWAQPPNAELPSHMSFPGDPIDTDDDPQWIDYNAFREDVLYLKFVSRWAEVVREAVPKHWLFHSNAQDCTSQWHFLHFFRRAELPFAVIGVGCHDSGANLDEIPPWDRLRKYVKNIASYRPYVLAPGSPAVAVSSGEGEGGKSGDEPAIRDYYCGQSMEMVGHGAGFEQSYTWAHLSGAQEDPDGRGHLTKALEWMGGFYRAVDGVTFSLKREVPILVVRNNNLQRSNRSGHDYGNVLGLASFLAQLNVEFDIAMDQDCVYGAAQRKIDLSSYRLLFLPSVECDYLAPFWQALDAWLTDPAHKGERSLVVGNVGKRTPYLAPTGAFQPTLAKWLGATDYAATVPLRGSQEPSWQPRSPLFAAGALKINFGERGDGSPLGLFDGGEPLLTLPDGRALGIATTCGGNAVYAFGFPLGLAFDNLWGLPYGLGNGKPAPQEPDDVLASLYEDLVEAAGVTRPIRAPHNVRVAVSDDRSVILVRELFGRETTDLCTLALPAGAKYEGCELIPQAGGRTLLRAKLPAYGGRYFKRAN